MILSVSRRTDIPAFYSEWFFNRLKEGFVYVRNPMNIHQVSRIALSPDVIDCIAFWSKNPKPMLNRLEELKDYMYYFQFTINPYDKGLELGVPRKEGIINTFKELSEKLGPKRVIWRYDPILLTDNMDIDYHLRYFEEIAKRLKDYTNTCVISFVDLYKKTQRNLQDTTVREPSMKDMMKIAAQLFLIANKYGITVQACAEEIALETVGVKHGKCIDNALIEDLLGVKLVVSKDPNQRKECGCVQSIDIGEYNTCAHGCKYCYANFKDSVVAKNRMAYDPNSSLLVGNLGPDDKVTDKKLFSFIKIPEPFKVRDIVKLKHPENYKKTDDIYGYRINLYKIISIKGDDVKLEGVQKMMPTSELLPVAINGKEDRWIYYDPQVAASSLFGEEEYKGGCKDYTYFMDALNNMTERGKSYREMIEKKKLMYVHEVQYWLRKKDNGEDGLYINEWKS